MLRCAVVFLLLFMFTFAAKAQEDKEWDTLHEKVPTAKKRKKRPGAILEEKRMVERNKRISQEVDSLASSLDRFLSGAEGDLEVNTTSLVISNQFRHEEGGVKEYLPSFHLNLKLPNLEKKWKLKFSSYDESNESSGVSGKRIESDRESDSLGTSIELNSFFKGIKSSITPRLQLSPVVGMSYLIKFEKPIGDEDTRFLPNLSFYAKPEKGTGLFTGMNIVFELSKIQYFTVINEWEYSDFDNSFSANNGFSHSYIVANRRSISSSLIFESTNRPVYHLDKIVLATGFYHKWYYKVFHYEVIPYLSFSKEFNFKGKAGIRFNANFIF